MAGVGILYFYCRRESNQEGAELAVTCTRYNASSSSNLLNCYANSDFKQLRLGLFPFLIKTV